LSVGAVVVGAGGAVVVVVVGPEPVLPVDPVDAGAVVVVAPPPVDVPAVVVVVVVGGAGGATNGTVSLRMVVRLVEGPVDRSVQLRAAFQLWTAVAAGAPVNG
jgi:hypothetical protein